MITKISFLYSLQELLKKADSTLSDTATEALLSRQFMKGLPDTMRFKLLEHNPKPTLVEMVAFCKQFSRSGSRQGLQVSKTRSDYSRKATLYEHVIHSS